MKNFKKIKPYFLLICFLINLIYVGPTYSLSSQEELFKNALNLSSSGQFNLALNQWNNYLELFPDDAAALSNRGNIKLVIGDSEGALEDQDKAIDLDPDVVDPYINRGIAEESLGLWQKAKKDYLYVLSKDKDNFSALYNFANVEGSLSDWQSARNLFSKASESILVLQWQDPVWLWQTTN